MLERYILIYIFVCFALGLACLGVTLALVQRRSDRIARSFLAYYAALSIIVTSALLLAYTDTLSEPIASSTRFWLEYMESFIGRYGVMLTLPLFAHRVFAVKGRSRDRWILTITLVTFIGQHITEHVFGGTRWDDRGDVAEDLVFAGVAVYTCWVGFTRALRPGVYRPLAVRFNILVIVGLPGVAHDLFLSEVTGLRFYPLWYCVLSIVFTWTLFQHQKALGGARVPPEWDLSEREHEVVLLVQQGLSNKELAKHLGISVNTVKTHMRAIFEKSGTRSRIELMSRLMHVSPAPSTTDRDGRG